jgi:DNA-binding response OmpR family regulator
VNVGVALSAPSVLIVDHDPEVRRLFSLAFSVHGFVRDDADDGAEAVRKAIASPPSVAVVDLCLPRMDGFAVIRELKTRPETMGLPVLAITGQVELDLHERVHDAGGDALLIKPVTPDTLTSIARLLIERAALLREHASRVRTRAHMLIQRSSELQRRSASPPRSSASRSYRALACRFCGAPNPVFVRETSQTWVYLCSQCHKQWRRAKS